MKAIIVVTDSGAVPDFERAFVEHHRGFTVFPELVGMGRSGLKAGDRVHPGGSSLLFTVVPDDDLGETVKLLKKTRDEAETGEHTRMWSFAVDEIA